MRAETHVRARACTCMRACACACLEPVVRCEHVAEEAAHQRPRAAPHAPCAQQQQASVSAHALVLRARAHANERASKAHPRRSSTWHANSTSRCATICCAAHGGMHTHARQRGSALTATARAHTRCSAAHAPPRRRSRAWAGWGRIQTSRARHSEKRRLAPRMHPHRPPQRASRTEKPLLAGAQPLRTRGTTRRARSRCARGGPGGATARRGSGRRGRGKPGACRARAARRTPRGCAAAAAAHARW
jgi:hypothetical protein